MLPLFLLSAEEKIITLGGADSWPALSVSSGLTRDKGRLGQQSLVLSTEIQRGNPDDDLYLSFDSKPVREETGAYSVVSSSLLFVGPAKAQRGTGAALCTTSGSGLVLRGKPGTLFSNPGNSGSFNIEFWLFPAVTENGSVLFQWRSSRTALSASLYQYIRSSLFNNHLEWTFSNIWMKVPSGKASSATAIDVTIAGRKNLIPGEWSFHQLSYDANTGLLEYSLNGSTENIQYITSTGTERGTVFPAIFGASADIEIGTVFSGLIDEFRITRNPAEEKSLAQQHAVLDRYTSNGGRFESMPIDSKGRHSVLKKISVIQTKPEQTGTAFFVRSGDNFYEWNDTSPEWVPVQPGKPVSGVKGRYFQIAGELYPDGLGLRSPSVTSVSMYYEPDFLPEPPAKIIARAGTNSVTLTWVASIDSDTAGYVVYYGERPGEYLGEGTPINVGKQLSFTVNELKNGKQYYFSIASYDESGAGYPGSLSNEVYARPQAVANR